jgi:hypothetical protein
MDRSLAIGNGLGSILCAALVCACTGSAATETDVATRADGSSPPSTQDGGAPAVDASRPDPRDARSPFAWVGVIGTGQSLSTGCGSRAMNTTQPFFNIKLRDDGPDPRYPVDGARTAVWSVVPLVEPIRGLVPGYGDDGRYPANICRDTGTYGETPHSGFANTLSSLWTARGLGDYVTAHTVVGWGGRGIQELGPNGQVSYQAALAETRVYHTLAQSMGASYGVAGILLTHGETDSRNAAYGTALYDLWRSYNADLRGITGQTRDVVMFGSQESAVAGGYNSSAVQLWRAGVEHPRQIVCTGPKYAYGDYWLHMNAPMYERLGEKYAEVFDLVVNQGVDWRPLGPHRVARAGRVVTIDFDVPNPPLAWDETIAAGHQTRNSEWARGRGFEVVDAAMRHVAIESVAIRGASVVLTLASDPPAGAALTLGYGLTPDADTDGNWGGVSVGPHGQLRDSDPFAGYSRETITVQVTQGSAEITVASGSDLLARRAPFDVVTGDRVAEGTTLIAALQDRGTLSAPWSGPSGTARLSFRHGHYNYCVHFAMPIP